MGEAGGGQVQLGKSAVLSAHLDEPSQMYDKLTICSRASYLDRVRTGARSSSAGSRQATRSRSVSVSSVHSFLDFMAPSMAGGTDTCIPFPLLTAPGQRRHPKVSHHRRQVGQERSRARGLPTKSHSRRSSPRTFESLAKLLSTRVLTQL